MNIFTALVPVFDNFLVLTGFDAVLADKAVITAVEAPSINNWTNPDTDATTSFDSFSLRIECPTPEGKVESIFVNTNCKDMDAMVAMHAELDALIKAGNAIKMAGIGIRAKCAIKRRQGEKPSVSTKYYLARSATFIDDEVIESAVEAPCFS
jgi:hypothetical protein